MRVPGSSASLRPLGLGEILDRAVTLCVRFSVPLASIYVWYAIPLGVASYFSSQGITRLVTVLTDGARSGHPASQDQVFAALQNQPSDLVWSLVAVFFAFFVSPLPTAALIEASTAFYLGRSSSVREAYRVALDRYWNMLGILCLALLAGIVLYVAIVVVVLIAALVFAALALVSKVLAVVAGVIAGIVAFCLLLAFVVVFVFVLQIANFSCVVERANAVAASSRSMRRAFSGIGLKRTLLIGLIYIAIGLGIGLVSVAGEGVVVGLLHSKILGAVFQTIVRLATAAFTTAFIGIFYLDLRVREEGLDLQLATEAGAAAVLPAE